MFVFLKKIATLKKKTVYIYNKLKHFLFLTQLEIIYILKLDQLMSKVSSEIHKFQIKIY